MGEVMKGIAQRIVAIQQLERPDPGEPVQLEPGHDGVAPERGAVAKPRGTQVQPATQLEMLEDVRLGTGVEPQVETQAGERAAQRIQAMGLA